ncbi:MAG: phosphatidylserine decarboxylase family protein [Blastocatellia bacterium]
MAKEGIPFVLLSMLAAMLLGYFNIWSAAAIFALLAGFMIYFFRDPHREIPMEPGVIVAAADGRVTRIDETPAGKLVSVFMSPFDVHINRSPIAGEIVSVEYVKGRKLPATSVDASYLNERNTITIRGENTEIKVTQIAGIVARRVVCWYGQGAILGRGQKFGLIKFSSRTDVALPPNAALLIRVGDHVKGGETIIARLD